MWNEINAKEYKEAIDYLLNIPKFVIKSDENSLCEALKRCGNPEKELKVIHVAGTNGKGSTCAFVRSILIAAGKTVGMFSSPHLVRINERININGTDISDKDFLCAFKKVKIILDEMKTEGYSKLCQFEVFFLLAMVAFREKKVEYAVLETGLGGRLDATNVVKKPLVTIITTVSMDHTEILGETIEAIALEKAGIIKKNVPIVFYGENAKVAEIIEKKASEMDAKIVCIKNNSIKIIEKTHKTIDFCIVNMYDKYGVLRVPFVMEYQAYNCALAIAALEHIEELELDADTIKRGLLNTSWAGRMQEIMDNVFLDGAHNEEGLREFVKYVGSVEEDVHLLFSVVKEKDYMSMVGLLNTLKNVKSVVVAPVKGARALSTEHIIPLMKNVNIIDKPTIAEGFEYAISNRKSKEKLFCVGSLYMVGEIMEYIQKG